MCRYVTQITYHVSRHVISHTPWQALAWWGEQAGGGTRKEIVWRTKQLWLLLSFDAVAFGVLSRVVLTASNASWTLTPLIKHSSSIFITQKWSAGVYIYRLEHYHCYQTREVSTTWMRFRYLNPTHMLSQRSLLVDQRPGHQIKLHYEVPETSTRMLHCTRRKGKVSWHIIGFTVNSWYHPFSRIPTQNKYTQSVKRRKQESKASSMGFLRGF